jgi:hypothetical protein
MGWELTESAVAAYTEGSQVRVITPGSSDGYGVTR